MKKYREISCTDYVVQELKCKCNTCNLEFLDYIPLNYELVCFKDGFGTKYFLPTYGENGYLDLLQKLVEDWTPGKQITKSVVKKFEEKLVEVTPHVVSLFQNVRCPACSKDDVVVMKRTPIKNHPVKWMEIDIEY